MTPISTPSKRNSPETNGERIPPLQNGDRLTVEEFERRYSAMPENVKAELIDGVVHIAAAEVPDGPVYVREPNHRRIPPLENGDHLTIEEFERRYNAMPHIKKAELINGVVYMASPVLHEEHGSPHFDVIAWLGVYKALTPGVDGGDNSTLKLPIHLNWPQPDAFLRILPAFGGQSRTSGGFIIGAPELIGEIAATSVNYDLHDKLDGYRENGVREYVVWRVWDKAIDWFVLRDNRYDRLDPDSNGLIQSIVFPGLWLDTAAMLRRDLAQVLSTLQQGLASPEHAAFVAQMKQRSPGA